MAVCIVKKVKKKRENKLRQINIESNRVLLVTSEKPAQSSTYQQQPGVILAYDNGVSGGENNSKTFQNGVQNGTKSKSMMKNKSLSRNHLHSTPITYYVNGEVHSKIKTNGEISNKKTLPSTIMPPVEKFDRPKVHALDNVSAISLDEYWQKIGPNF